MSGRLSTAARRFALRGLEGTYPVGVTDDAQNANPQVQSVALPLWINQPPNWENFDQLGYVALPAIGQTATIFSFTIPIGRNGIIRGIANNFVGGGFQEGAGGVIWRILVDNAPPPGASSYNNILGSLGSPSNPVEIAGFRVFENQTLSMVIQNVNIVVAGQIAGGRLLGYLYPRDLEQDDIWI